MNTETRNEIYRKARIIAINNYDPTLHMHSIDDHIEYTASVFMEGFMHSIAWATRELTASELHIEAKNLNSAKCGGLY